MTSKITRIEVANAVNDYIKNVNKFPVENPLKVIFQNDLHHALDHVGIDIALKAIEKQITPTDVHPSASLIFQAIAQYKETGFIN